MASSSFFRRVALGAAASAMMLMAAAPAPARSILFVGNSFTFGAASAVHRYRPDRVIDLNGEGVGGVPALFATFAAEAGLDWTVSLETSSGKDLAYHLATKRAVIDRPWDAVILQGYSTLDAERPGDPTRHIAAARALAGMMRARNPLVEVDLVSTWSRADQTYKPSGHWFGKPITRMADDLMAASRRTLAGPSALHAVVAVGPAWNRAMAEGLADPNPYDGIAFGQVSLWSWDQYHATAEGYYLEALMVFGTVTKVDPRTLDDREQAADDLGLHPDVARQLRAIAAAELMAQGMLPRPPAP